VDVLVAAVTDPFDEVHMGITAEKCRRGNGESRETTRMSWRWRAIVARWDAINTGKFKGQIVPIEQKTKSGPVYFITDEQRERTPRKKTWPSLKPAFDPEGTVTAGQCVEHQ